MLVISYFVGFCLFFPTVNTENPVKASFHWQHLRRSHVRHTDVTSKDGSGGPEPQSEALNARTFLLLEKKPFKYCAILFCLSSYLKFWKRFCRRWKNVKKRKQEFERPENITEFQNLGSKKLNYKVPHLTQRDNYLYRIFFCATRDHKSRNKRRHVTLHSTKTITNTQAILSNYTRTSFGQRWPVTHVLKVKHHN